MKKTLVFASVLVSSALAFAAGTSVIKISRLSDTQAAISCKNGADPTGRKEGDVVSSRAVRDSLAGRAGTR